MIDQLQLWTPEKPPDTYEFSISWADGCQELQELEKLARLVKERGHDVIDDNGKYWLFHVVGARIADGRVWATCTINYELMTKLGMFKDRPTEEEDDEC